MSAKKFLKKILTGIFILSLIGNNFFYVFAQSVDTWANQDPTETTLQTGELLYQTGTVVIDTGIDLSWTVSQDIFQTGGSQIIQDTQTEIIPLPPESTKKDLWNTLLNKQHMRYVPWELIVKFKPTKLNLTTAGWKIGMQNFAMNHDMNPTNTLTSNNIAVMKIEWTESVEQKIVQLQSDSNIEYVQPNYIYHVTSNDPWSWNLWALPNIDRYSATNIFSWTNSLITGTIIAVIDMWVAYNHPDLTANMRNGNNCNDENGNYLWWCIHGYDYVDNDKDPMWHIHSHGTHVAGTIAAEMNNGIGIMGINPHAKIMTLRAGENWWLATDAIINSINFAKYNGARIINASFGGADYDTWTHDAIANFPGLFITAAGNDYGSNDDTTPFYPCSYTLDNIICVAATDQNGNLAWFSNFGSNSVDLAAPGVNIYSTVKWSTTWYFNGFVSSLWDFSAWWSQSTRLYNSWAATTAPLVSHMGPPTYETGVSDSYIQNTTDLSPYVWARLSFEVVCDTPLSSTLTGDYIKFSLSSWSNFSELMKTNEHSSARVNTGIDAELLYYDWGISWPAYYEYFEFDVSQFISSSFKMKFNRYSDNNYDQVNWANQWCTVDNITIIGYDWWSAYDRMNWTSMATPHVAGLASIAWSMSPNSSYQTIKSILLWSGDSLSSLTWKTVSGKRINAYKTLIALWWTGWWWPDRWIIYTNIWNTLSWAWILNNFSSVNNSNVSSFTGLYFAKMSGSNELGRIIFYTWLDLTDTGTQNFLSGELPNSIWMQQGQIRFNPGTGFVGKNATLKMNIPDSYSWFLWSMDANSFAVRESSGGALTGNSVITSVYSGGACSPGNFGCSIYLTVGHFTEFDIKPIASIIYTPATLTNGNVTAILTWYSESLTGINATSHVFTGNGSFTFTFSDLAGNTGSSTATVTWIDTSPVTWTISYSPATLTNGNVVASIIFNKTGVTVTNNWWATWYVFTNTGSFTFTYQDALGNTGSSTATVTWIDKIAPTATWSFSTTALTNGNVSVTLTGYSETLTWINTTSHVFTGNDSFTFTFSDLAGNTGSWTAIVNNIDKIAPTATGYYSTIALTSWNVTATVTWFSETITWLNATNHIFTGNGSFTFTFSDLAGNTGSWTAIVNNIDKIAPTATISYSPSSLTNQDVIATINWNESITWILTHIFTGNGSFVFAYTDLAGNTGSSTATVTWIDKIPVIWTISYSPATLTNGNVIASIIFNKTWVTVTNNWWATWYIFANTGSFTFTYQDAVGNTGSSTATVTWIDKIAPTANVIYTNTWANVLATLSWSETLTGQNTTSKLFTGNGSFTFTFSDLAGNTGSTTANVILQISSGTVSTWATNIGWATPTGITFNSTGTLNIISTGSSNNILLINVSGLQIQAPWGTWDGVLLPPSTVDSSSTGYANFGETWLPAASEWSTTRTILLTLQAWSTTDSLTASGGYFTISFVVAWWTSGNTIKLYRSTNWSTWTANTPDTSCVLNSNLVCNFRTDHLSYFTTIKETTSSSGWGGGGWGGGWGGESGSSGSNTTGNVEILVPKVTTKLSWSIANSPFAIELNNAYLYAYDIGITTIPTIQRANITWFLLRSHMAKMMVNYSIRVLGKTLNTWANCNFTDLTWQSTEMKGYIKWACQLGIMGIGNATFNPNGQVTRAQFGTVLSRTLYGEIYNTTWTWYYLKHLAALKEKGIISNISPTLKEVRWYVMLMLMRAAN